MLPGKSQLGYSQWIAALLVVVMGLWVYGGCTRKKAEEEYLLRVRSLSMSPSEFNQAVKAASEEAFPGEQNMEPSVLNDLCMRVLTQITEEMMISAYAADQGIQVSNEELDKVVADIKADYPDSTFEETLLENAISLQFWRKQLAARLLVEKVITKRNWCFRCRSLPKTSPNTSRQTIPMAFRKTRTPTSSIRKLSNICVSRKRNWLIKNGSMGCAKAIRSRSIVRFGIAWLAAIPNRERQGGKPQDFGACT
ncbi:MAG: SurA N-terminal domain-containing protein [Desulfobacterales bacterium]|nr:SurA N-terminal domain-containing protein [Desulfobacterales bacterium]